MSLFLITGGLGLVGTNYAAHVLAQGHDVTILDNAARGASNHQNWGWLAGQFGNRVRWVYGDLADSMNLNRAFTEDVTHVAHFGAQSSVNTSMKDPVLDFRSNVLGTFNVLEAIRARTPMPKLVFFASNKVYRTSHIATMETATRYDWADSIPLTHFLDDDARWAERLPWDGCGEDFPFWTDAEEPYGASKITGFTYCRAYAALYKVPVSIAVPSGMYGPRGFGKEEQGWLPWFVIATMLHRPITIYGTGKQVRDMLYVDDVCRAVDILFGEAEVSPGTVWNLSGGRENAVSLHEALQFIQAATGIEPIVKYDEWRARDNRVYYSGSHRLRRYGWKPEISVPEGIQKMVEWVKANMSSIRGVYGE